MSGSKDPQIQEDHLADTEEDGGESDAGSRTQVPSSERKRKTTKSKKEIIPKNPNQSPNSNRLTRLSLDERVRIVRLYSKYKLPGLVQKAWVQNGPGDNSSTCPPSCKTIVAINKKFDKTGTVADNKRTGRPKTSRSAENIEKVLQAIQQSPTKSVRGIAREVGLNKATVHRIKQEKDKQQKQLRIENNGLRDRISELERRLEKYEGKRKPNENIRIVDDYVNPTTTAESNSQPQAEVVELKRTKPISSTIRSISSTSAAKKSKKPRITETVILEVPSAAPTSLQLVPIGDGTTPNNVFTIQGPDGEGIGTGQLLYSESTEGETGNPEEEKHTTVPADHSTRTETEVDGKVTAVLQMVPDESWIGSST